jgi:HlyD family type I secretion membrane fusion protein
MAEGTLELGLSAATDIAPAQTSKAAAKPVQAAPTLSQLSPARAARGAILLGAVAILTGFGGFGTWSAVSSLDSAAVARGEITVSTYRKTVQHLEGGIVREILVHDGSQVKAGDVLIRLDPTQARATYALLQNQIYENLALRSRLRAERDGAAEITFDPELLSHNDDANAAAEMRGQAKIFSSRRQLLDGRIAVLHQRVQLMRQEIVALDAQQKSRSRQLELITEEINTQQGLVNRGLGQKPRLLELQRQSAEIEGQRGDLLAQIVRTNQSIGGIDLDIMGLQNERLNEVTTGLRDADAKLHELQERLASAEDTLKRIDIRAPQDGVVVGLRVHTPGGVIGAREAVMDIVPQDADLLVEARVPAEDIEAIHPGLSAEVRLTAYKQRTTPTVPGEVTVVSADRMHDDRTGENYYVTRVHLDEKALAQLPHVKLYPGMPAEVLIITGRRSAFDYIVSPITQALPKAFREK